MRDLVDELEVSTTLSPPAITIRWNRVADAKRVTIARKRPNDIVWGGAVTLPNDAVHYTDTTVQRGVVYEYKLRRVRGGLYSTGYIAAGINVPAVHQRGTVLALVDATLVSLASNEIERFLQDLRGDGWRVIKQNVDRTAPVTEIRRLIQAVKAANSSLRALVLLGHVPQPYSGRICPDAHRDHWGAWPTDAYYADLISEWTDTAIVETSASDPRNHNVPGDGKFDQSLPPNSLQLEVGRVDFAGMTAFAQAGETAIQTEARLLRRYLQKNHDCLLYTSPSPRDS